jgi:hypothetical protein
VKRKSGRLHNTTRTATGAAHNLKLIVENSSPSSPFEQQV